jgi:transcriptional regulator
MGILPVPEHGQDGHGTFAGHSVRTKKSCLGTHFLLVVDNLGEYNGCMPKKGSPPLEGELLQGTLDLLILQTLVLGAAHGHTIAYAIEHRSEEVLQVEHGSLYPALHRLEDRGWVASSWATSENNRRARFYRLTPAGRQQLAHQTSRWDELVRAINRILRPEEARG